MSRSGAQRRGEVGLTVFPSLLRDACAATLPAWLESRRWFSDKGRDIAEVGIEDALFQRVEPDRLALVVVSVAFNDGSAARYLLPLALTQSPGDAEVIIRAESESNGEFVVDATEKAWFGGWLLENLGGATVIGSGDWVFAPHPTAEAEIAAAGVIPAKLMRAEQSNTSLRFGDILLVKLFRRLQAGTNPDEEVLRALATSRFARVPHFAGSVSWRSSTDESCAVAVALSYVPNAGDGWSWMLQRLDAVAAGQVDPRDDRFTEERMLGRRTGELHAALADVSEPEFVPEVASATAIDADSRRTRAAIEETIALLQEREALLPDQLRATLPDAIDGLRALSGRASGYSEEASTWRIRVHGDFHLGQTLRTPDGDWTIIDFEGEPGRPLDERRQKASAMKDVAGMLRSFAYARGVAGRTTDPAVGRAAGDRLATWETGARDAFLAGYRQALAASAVQLAPEDDVAFLRALAAWELDKALYEIAYEARNRPEWIELPLRGLLPGLLDQPVDAAGGAPA
jgi:trehalose synthase-fused probable maltokinase